MKKKMKTHKGIKKRIKITGGGKLLRRHARRSHLREKKSSKRKRHYLKELPLSRGNRRQIKKLLPYK